MSALLFLVTLCDVILPQVEPVDRAATIARYSGQCGGAAALTPGCKQTQWQLEQLLYEDLRAGAPADHELLRVAASADVPVTAALGLARLGERYTAADEPIVLAQLESPYALVRRAAFGLAEQRSIQSALRLRPRLRLAGAPPKFPIADEPPGEKRLGAAVYPGAAFRALASDERRAFYTTSDAPDKVAAFYRAAGKQVLTLEQVKEEQQRRLAQAQAQARDPMAMARAMQEAVRAGKDPQKVIAEMTAKMSVGRDFKEGLASEPGVVAPRVVVLDAGMTRGALLFRDDILGATALVFTDVPTEGDLVQLRMMTSPQPDDIARMQRRQRALMILSQPLSR